MNNNCKTRLKNTLGSPPSGPRKGVRASECHPQHFGAVFAKAPIGSIVLNISVQVLIPVILGQLIQVCGFGRIIEIILLIYC